MPGDEDNWQVEYPAPLVIWLLNMLTLCDWKWSIPDILATERQYPGLMHMLDTVQWQRQLVKDQLKNDKA